jgi:hypothetical protein
MTMSRMARGKAGALGAALTLSLNNRSSVEAHTGIYIATELRLQWLNQGAGARFVALVGRAHRFVSNIFSNDGHGAWYQPFFNVRER